MLPKVIMDDQPTRVILCAVADPVSDDLLALCGAAGFRVVARACGQRDLADLALSVACDAILMCVAGWSTTDALAACEDSKITAAVPLLLVVNDCETELCRRARSVGVDGVITLPTTLAQLTASVEFVIAGADRRSERSGAFPITVESPERDVVGLSAREHEVFRLLAQGYRTQAIGRTLFISPHTVRKHAKVVFRKLGVHSQVELMRGHFERTTRR